LNAAIPTDPLRSLDAAKFSGRTLVGSGLVRSSISNPAKVSNGEFGVRYRFVDQWIDKHLKATTHMID
jgi:hypothetical protein